MLGIIALVLGGLLLTLLAAFALLEGTRGTPVSVVTARGDDGPPAVADPDFRSAIEAYVGVTLHPGHDITLFRDGDGTYPALWADLRAARRYIAFQMYYAKPGRVADELREVLVERARAGVEVLLLLDAFGSSLKKDYLESLKAAGVTVAKFRSLKPHSMNTAIHRAHVRAIVVDGEVGWTGGFGIDDKWLGDGRTGESWRDTNVRVTGPAIAQLLATFASCWAEATEELITGRRYWPSIDELKESGRAGPPTLAGVLHAAPTIGSTPAERLIALTVAGARKRLWITTAYFVPDDDFRRLVKDAAQRGADVRILTSGERSDVRTTHLAARARYEELMECGVRIFEYAPTMLHAKTIVVDGVWCTVGTMNLDNRSMAFNNECNLLALDARLADALERMFEDDLRHATEIDPARFRERSIWTRIAEQGAHLMSRIL